MKPVVVPDPAKERPPRHSHRGDEVVQKADILGLPVVHDAAIGCGELAADLLRPVGGRVVGDHELQVLVGLREHRCDDLGKPFGPVADREADRDQRSRSLRPAMPSASGRLTDTAVVGRTRARSRAGVASQCGRWPRPSAMAPLSRRTVPAADASRARPRAHVAVRCAARTPVRGWDPEQAPATTPTRGA